MILVLALSAAVVFLLLPNRDTLELPFVIGNYSISVWGAIVSAFTLGALFGLVFELTGLGRGAATRLRALWSSRQRQAGRRALERGRQAERESRIDEAIVCYREAVHKSPRDFRARMQLGDALRRAGRTAAAIGEHEQARLLDPESDEPGHALALDHLEAGHLDDARRELTSLVERSPKSAIGPLRQLRDLEIRAGRWEDAERAQRRLESLLRGQPASERDHRQGLGIRTESARERARGNHARSASGIVKRILKTDPDFLPAIVLLAELQAEAGDPAGARKTLLLGFGRTGEPALLAELAEIDLARERPEDAIATLRGLVAGQQHAHAAQLALGKLYQRLEMHDEAAEVLGRLHVEAGGPALVGSLLGRSEERRGQVGRAAALYREVLLSPGRGIPEAVCGACQAELESWAPRCHECGAFGAVSSSGTLGPTDSSLDRGLATGPVYSVKSSD
ncbi:MAG: tetratricopeptide repeat protein [Acidobacteriota bacterium]|nr:MAG: tetratricopeptide repeat protein [Acidobacteriota bacterium]